MAKYKNKKCVNMFFNLLAYVSTAITLVFCIQIHKLDMVPQKYLNIIWISLGVIYFILLLFTFPRKLKVRVKTISCVFFIVFGLLFGLGIKYIDVTKNFFNRINDELSQKEDYYVMTLSKSNYTDVLTLKDKSIGVYLTETTKNTNKAVQMLNKKVKSNIKEYADVVTMLEDLSKEELDAVLINDSIITLLSGDLKYMKLELKKIAVVSVPIDEIDIAKVVDVTNTPFSIYVAGGDAYGKIGKIMNTDVNMVVTIDPVKHDILLTSIPRDYYVNLPSKGENAYDKLTHAGYYGINESVKAVEKLLDMEINYYVKVNFSTIEGVVDAIGGIDVYSDYAFREDAFKTYYYKKGINHLNGKQALAFARERHAFSDGDVQRVKNQQKVLTAVINKITKSTALITKYSTILNSISDNISMNISSKSISRLVKMQLDSMPSWNIDNQNLVGKDLYTKGTYTFPRISLYVMKQDEKSVNDAREKIKLFLGEEVITNETIS